MAGPDRDAVHEERAGLARRPRRCGRRVRRSSRRSRSRGRLARRRRASAAPIRAGSSGATGSDSTVQPISRACAASISELVSTSSPGAGSEPSGRTSSPVGMTMTCGARRTVSAVWPAAPAAARSTGRSRCPSGSSSSVALTSSPIVRTCCHGAAAARTSGTPSSQCTCSRMTTASKPSGSASPVSTTREPGDGPRRGLGGAEGVGGADRDAVHRGRVVGGRGAQRPDGRGRHPSERVGELELDGLDPADGVQPGRERLGGGDVGQERGARRAHAQP